MEKQIQKPLGIIDALYGGFELVFTRPWIIVIPVLLDMFLWLGPRLTAAPIFQQFLAIVTANQPPNATPEMIQNLDAAKQVWLSAGDNFNLFAVLAFAAIGMPSLIGADAPSVSILRASPPGYSVSGALPFLGFIAVMIVVGVLFGTVYLELIAQGVRREPSNAGVFATRTFKSYVTVGVLLVFAIVGSLVALIPFGLGAAVAALFDQSVASFLLLLGLMLLMWAALYLSFSIPAIFVSGANAWQAVVSSVAVFRYNFWSAIGLLFLVILIERGFQVIWQLFLASTWGVVTADLANAFLGSALIAATMLFYHDRFTFLMRVREQLRQQQQKLG